ncbi:MAG: UPF0182 family protein [Armatimonadetes bacterium]|nr:UPF0182 family protein [Armatimonadota bacterium]
MSGETYRMPNWQRVLYPLAGIALLIMIFGGRSLYLYTEWLWFREVGYSSVFSTTLATKAKMGVAMGLIFFIILTVNAALTRRLAPPTIRFIKGRILDIPERNIFEPYIGKIVVAASALMSFLIATEAATRWDDYLRFRNATPFGVQDPIFQKDVSFYIFTLPFYNYLTQWATFVLILTIMSTAVLYSFYGALRLIGRATETQFQWPEVRIAPNVREHLSVLAGLSLIGKAFGYKIQTYGLLFSDHGFFYGAGYTDIHARMWFLNSLFIVAVACGLLLIANVFVRSWKPLIGGLGFWLLLSMAGSVVPGLVQQLSVTPNEINREEPYIAHNIKFTRMAYGLDKVEPHDFPGDQDLTSADLQRNELTLKNARLWDHRPALATYGQLQGITQYYRFSDIDIDRYILNGELRQMLLSPREMNYDALLNRTWINEHMIYTHGYGLAMSPVNQVSPEGMPVFLIKNIPPETPPDIPVKRPELYYGELSSEYSFVRTTEEEFDYPIGDTEGQVARTVYKGEGGVPVGSLGRKIAFASRFNSLKILLNRSLTSESRVLFHRRIPDRLTQICPFLEYDPDPYLVVADGRLYWFVDAYTTSPGYPYATPYSVRKDNYIRNSVKAVVDAYNGTCRFYVFDPEDPLLQTYRKIFPDLFLPRERMPKSLLAHIRYPELLFKIQGDKYCRYHVQDPQVFYNREDDWNIPKEQAYSQQQGQLMEAGTELMQPYYNIMRLPGEKQEEFIIMWPFTIASKQNMSAWMCAKSDPDDYGKLIVYRFPKSKLFFGPEQIESRIKQNTQISSQLTLWNQQGSQVIWGNLLVLPIEQSLIYIRPLYLQTKGGDSAPAVAFPFAQPGMPAPTPLPSRGAQMPEFKRVVVVYGSQVVMEQTLEEALYRIFGSRPSAPVRPSPITAGALRPAPSADTSSLASQAMSHYNRAEQSSRQGDWAAFGSELKKLKAILEQMNR